MYHGLLMTKVNAPVFVNKDLNQDRFININHQWYP